MPPLKLTKRNVDSLKPAAERFTAWDSDVKGFGLRITPTGGRVYVLKYRIPGAQRWFTVGRHGPPWPPDGARREAVRLLGEGARGHDPAEKRSVDRKAMSFADCGDLYFSESVAHKKTSTLHVDHGRFKLHLRPLLGVKRAGAITRADIERLLNDVMKGRTAASAPKKRRPGSVAKGGSGVAAQCVRLASAIMQFAAGRGIRPD